MFERYLSGLRWTYRLPALWVVYWYFSGEFQSPPTSGQVFRLAIYTFTGLVLDVRRLFKSQDGLPFGLYLIYMVIGIVWNATDEMWPISVLFVMVLLMPLDLRWRHMRQRETFCTTLYETYARPFLEPEVEVDDR